MKCIFCKESNIELMEQHHTIPRSINPNWTQSIDVCVKCHKIIHRFVIQDMVNLLKNLKEGHMTQHKYFTENGMISLGFDKTKTHEIIIDYLYDNLPSPSYRKTKHIFYKQIIKDLKIEGKNDGQKGQRIGYVLKDLNIAKSMVNGRSCISYSPQNISKIKRLEKTKF